MTDGYSRGQILLHWIVVVLLAAQFLLAEGMEEAFEAREHGATEETGGAGAAAADGGEAVQTASASALPGGALVHMLLGAALFGVMAIRLAVRVSYGAPPAPAEDPPWQRRLSRAVHGLFYVLLIGMPAFGAVAWFGPSEALAEAHGFAASVLLVAVGLHIAGAVYGQAVQKTGVLDRMLRPGRQ